MADKPDEMEDRLERFYAAERKYHALPIPAGMPRDRIVDFVKKHADAKLPPRSTYKLSGLAIFYGLGETVEDFDAMLNKRETEAADYARSTYAMIANCWIGDNGEVAATQTYFQKTLHRAEVQRDKFLMASVCDALGPMEGTDNLRKWIQAEIDKLKKRIADMEAQGNEGGASAERARLADTDEFLRFDVPVIDDANAVRKQLEQIEDDATLIRRLTALYLGDDKDSNANLEPWAGLRLVQMGRDKRTVGGRIGAEFMTRAKRYEPKDPKKQDELDHRRARCLRGADFFGVALTPEDQEWLEGQVDRGTDLVALRPEWEYPTREPEPDPPGGGA